MWVWNAGKVTSTECKGRSRDDYEQHATAETPNARIHTERGQKHTRSTQIQNNSNNSLSTNVLMSFPLCEHQQLLMRHQRLSSRYGSAQQPDLAQGTVCPIESQRARIRVSERVWCRIFRWYGLHGLQCGKPKAYERHRGASFSRRRGKYLVGPITGSSLAEVMWSRTSRSRIRLWRGSPKRTDVGGRDGESNSGPHSRKR